MLKKGIGESSAKTHFDAHFWILIILIIEQCLSEKYLYTSFKIIIIKCFSFLLDLLSIPHNIKNKSISILYSYSSAWLYFSSLKALDSIQRLQKAQLLSRIPSYSNSISVLSSNLYRELKQSLHTLQLVFFNNT